MIFQRISVGLSQADNFGKRYFYRRGTFDFNLTCFPPTTIPSAPPISLSQRSASMARGRSLGTGPPVALMYLPAPRRSHSSEINDTFDMGHAARAHVSDASWMLRGRVRWNQEPRFAPVGMGHRMGWLVRTKRDCPDVSDASWLMRSWVY